MSTTGYSVNNNLTNKLWAKKLNVEVLKDAYISKFIGKGADSLIQYREDTNKDKGDRIRHGLRMQLSGAGVMEDNTLEGQEEQLLTYSDDVIINQLRHAVRSEGRMSEQRVLFDLRTEAKAGLKDWWTDRLDTMFFNQVCGYTAQTDLRYTGMNSPTAPDSNHIMRTSNVSADETITSSGTFNLSFVDYCVERAKTLTPAIRPIKTELGDYYVMFIHPYQATDLRVSTSTGQWLDIQKAALAGGKIKDNPIFTGALGVYNNTILHESVRVTNGVNSTSAAAITTVKRAVFCGAQAAVVAFGGEDGPDTMSWTEETFDYGNQLGVAVGSILGMKKSTYNSTDFACIVASTYAAQHNPGVGS